MLTCVTSHSIEEVNRHEWDMITDGDYFMSYSYLAHLAKTMSADFAYHYVTVYEGATPVAVAALFCMKLDIGLLSGSSALNKIITLSRKIYKDAFFIKTLVLGSPPSIANKTIVFSKQCSNKKDVLNAIINEVENVARAENSHLIMCKEFDCDFMRDVEPEFVKRGFFAGASMPNNILQLRWDAFDNYLYSMRKKYRDSVKDSLKKINDESIAIVYDYDLLENFSEEAYDLYLNVIKKSSTVFETLSRDFFHFDKDANPIDSCIISMYHADKLIGYFLVADLSENEFGILFAGIDYEYRKKFDTYFNLAFESIKLAIARGKRTISFGQTSYEFKKRIGCLEQELFLLFKHRNLAANKLLKTLSKKLFPKVSYGEKTVFKSLDDIYTIDTSCVKII